MFSTFLPILWKLLACFCKIVRLKILSAQENQVWPTYERHDHSLRELSTLFHISLYGWLGACSTVTTVITTTTDTIICYDLSSTNTVILSLLVYQYCNKDNVIVVALSPRGVNSLAASKDTTPRRS